MFKKSLFSLLMVLLTAFTALAQSTQLTAEELYEKARYAAFEENDYLQARDLLLQALEEHPDNHDYRIFLSRLHAWDSEYDDARHELMYILKDDPENREALRVIINVESWSGNDRQALNWSQKALTFYSRDKDFMMEQASACMKLGKTDEARDLYQQLLNNYPNDPEVSRIVQEQRLNIMKNKAEFSYRNDQFTEGPDPWNFFSFQLSRQTAIGPVIGEVKFADRFFTQGLQFNLEAYPGIYKGLYAHIMGGYSDSSIFPGYRGGISLYQSLPYNFEIEAGIRYLEFSEIQVKTYQTSLSKYLGNYFLSGRTYFVPSAEGDSYSFLFMARRYFKGNNKYVGLSAGFGSASSSINFTEDVRRLGSWFIEAKTEVPLHQRFNMGVSAAYIAEEFITVERNRIRGEVSVSYKF